MPSECRANPELMLSECRANPELMAHHKNGRLERPVDVLVDTLMEKNLKTTSGLKSWKWTLWSSHRTLWTFKLDVFYRWLVGDDGVLSFSIIFF